MFGLLKKITVRRRPQKQHTLKQQAERILQHDQLLLARESGRRDARAELSRADSPPAQGQPTSPDAPATPAALAAGFDEELRRLSKLMDLDD